MLTTQTALDPVSCAPPVIDENEPVMALLTAFGIEAIVYNLNGSGDSGDCTLEEVRYADGRVETRLPMLPIGFHDNGIVRYLDANLDHIASGLPDGDWCNNEGGHGTVILYPAETDPDLRYDADMTYREEGDYGDGDNDDDGDEVFDDIDPGGEPPDQDIECLLIVPGEEVRS